MLGTSSPHTATVALLWVAACRIAQSSSETSNSLFWVGTAALIALRLVAILKQLQEPSEMSVYTYEKSV